MSDYPASGYSLRRLSPADWELFRAIRLEALASDPGVYGSSLARESAFTDEQWQERLANPGNAYWALFRDAGPVGLTGIYSDPELPETAKLIASFIRHMHRGRGLSALFYEARIKWARSKGLRHLIVSHRAGNTASEAANQRAGFRYTHSETLRWPDGQEADHRFYRLDL